MPQGGRVLMIGVDAGDIDFIEASGDDLPYLQRALAGGRRFHLDSTTDVLTGSVWPTFYTGTLPGEHGVYHPIQWDPARMCARRVSDRWLPCEPFWWDLERRGVRLVAVDVPFAFPSRLSRGIEVNNWGTHEQLGSFFCNRSEIGRALLRRFGVHPMGHDTPVPRSPWHTSEVTRRLSEGAHRKGRIARWLMGASDWDLFLVVFAETHRGGHQLWPEPGYPPFAVPKDTLLEVYRAVDDAVGHVLDGVNERDATVVVFALHGMETNRSQGHFVRLLVDRINARFGNGQATERASEGGLVRALRHALPARLQHAIARRAPMALLDWVSNHEVTGGVDWRGAPGFALHPDLHGYVRLNLSGRESAGSLEGGSDRHRRYVDEVRAAFLSLEDATSGRRLVRDVLSVGDVFPGARSSYLPDLVVRWEALPQATRARTADYGEIAAPPTNGRCGDHRPVGFAALLGPGRNAALPPLAHGRDFPAFVRALLGQPGSD